ncbi:MAG: hypothetical protein K6B15_08000 [Parasporobacterium sp.]|nr:hypothetical protein [Parasporobacterium sp.]
MVDNINDELAKAITGNKIDYNYIAELMEKGADPLGILENGYDTSIDKLFCIGHEKWSYKDKNGRHRGCYSERFPKIMSLLIEKGFDCSRFKATEDGNRCLELWSLTFSISRGACETLQIMIENGLEIAAIEDFIGHFYMDSEMCDGSNVDSRYKKYLTWAFKMIMLCASYPHILDGSEYLRNCIEIENNDNEYDMKKFRNYDNYLYRFDYSTMDNIPYGVRNAGVEIIEKETNKVVWKMYV